MQASMTDWLSAFQNGSQSSPSFLRSGVFNPQGGIFSTPQISGGVMGGNTDQAAAKRDAILAASAQLLAGSGWSPQRRSFGELVGQAMMAGQNARAQSLNQAQDRRLNEAKIYALEHENTKSQSPFGNVDPDQFTPESLAKFQQSGSYGDLVPKQANVGSYNPGDYTPDTWAKFVQGGYKDPASLVRYVTPREQNPYFRDVTRVNPDGSTQQGVFNSRTGEYSWPNPVVPAGTKPRVDAAGAAIGKAEGEAAFDFPRVEGNVNTAIKTIDDLRNSPGLADITGVYSLAPVVPGTDQAAADALASQVEGQTFLQAFNTLKGGGAITETEGAKATTAIGRLKRAQSTKDYQAALDDLKAVLTSGLERARKQASGAAKQPGSPASSQPKKRYNPATGKIE